MLAGSEVHMSDGECLLATTRLFTVPYLSVKSSKGAAVGLQINKKRELN